jgi:hypothetical protein
MPTSPAEVAAALPTVSRGQWQTAPKRGTPRVLAIPGEGDSAQPKVAADLDLGVFLLDGDW